MSERHRADWRDWAIEQGLDLDKLCARSTENIEGKKASLLTDNWKEQARSPDDDVKPDHSEVLSALFDPVPVKALETMFPANKKWKKWAERAKRTGLIDARKGRGLFNPYRAAIWFVSKGMDGWDMAHCNRVLANNLPARSIDEKYLLTGDLE